VTPLGLHFVADSPVAGLAVAERRVGSPAATLICVHGGLDRGGSFARLARRTEIFDVIAYDRRGYQGSRDLGPLNLAGHVDDLLALARREGERGPVIFFGHSFGGVVTLTAVAREPSIAALVVNFESPLPWLLTRPGRRPAPTNDPALEAENFFRRMVSNSAWERLNEHERESRRLDGPALLSDLSMLRSAPPFDLARITTPAAYLHGDGRLGSYYRSLCEEITRANPSITTMELERTGHGAHLSSPDRLAALLGELWERQCASA